MRPPSKLQRHGLPDARKKSRRPQRRRKFIPALGWCERVGFPALGIVAIKAKIDTGARTTALHAYDLEPFKKEGRTWVRFTVHPDGTAKGTTQTCIARVIDKRHVADTSGRRERRYVIETTLCIGDQLWPVELTLTQRSYMRFDCLIGRTAIRRRFVVDPARSYIAGQPTNGRNQSIGRTKSSESKLVAGERAPGPKTLSKETSQ